MLSLKSACFRTEARPWETFELCLTGGVVSPPTPTFGSYLKIHAHEICNIYDIQTHLQPPFQKFYEHEV